MAKELEQQAAIHANKAIRKKAKKNPCYLCEQVDCEGCEYFNKTKGGK